MFNYALMYDIIRRKICLSLKSSNLSFIGHYQDINTKFLFTMKTWQPYISLAIFIYEHFSLYPDIMLHPQDLLMYMASILCVYICGPDWVNFNLKHCINSSQECRNTLSHQRKISLLYSLQNNWRDK